MRRGTTIVLAILLAMILFASVLQLFVLARAIQRHTRSAMRSRLNFVMPPRTSQMASSHSTAPTVERDRERDQQQARGLAERDEDQGEDDRAAELVRLLRGTSTRRTPAP